MMAQIMMVMAEGDVGDNDDDNDGCEDSIDDNPLVWNPDTDLDEVPDDCDPCRMLR